MNRNEAHKIQLVSEYFRKRKDISFAVLFGSRIDKTRPHSDWDIGVYFQPSSRELELENKLKYEAEEEILSDLTKILKIDNIDLVVLNRISCDLADVAVRKGLSLVIKDRILFLDFLLQVSKAAEDYRNLVNDYYQIYQRSSSLSEEDKISIEKRVVFLEKEVEDFSYYKKFDFSTYRTDAHKKREIERWVENIVNAILDISKIVLSSQKAEIPATYREVIEDLAKFDFSKETVQVLAGWVHLRNVLSHEYLDLKWQRISDFLDNGEAPCHDFLLSVKKIVK